MSGINSVLGVVEAFAIDFEDDKGSEDEFLASSAKSVGKSEI